MNVDMGDVWRHVTGESVEVTDNYRKVRCPFHKDRNPSASIRATRFHCHVCDISENPIGVLMLHHNITYREACDFVRQHAADFGTETVSERSNGGLLRAGVRGTGVGGVPEKSGVHRTDGGWQPSWKGL